MEVLVVAIGIWLILAWMTTKRRKKEQLGMAPLRYERESEQTQENSLPFLVIDPKAENFPPIKTVQARQLCRELLMQFGPSIGIAQSRAELGFELDSFNEELKEKYEELKDAVEQALEEKNTKVADLKCTIVSIKEQLAQAKGTSGELQQELMEELDLYRELIAEERLDSGKAIQEARAALAAFRHDKREFVVNWINIRFHGENWREMLSKKKELSL